MYLFPQAAGLETIPRGNFSHPKRHKMDLNLEMEVEMAHFFSKFIYSQSKWNGPPVANQSLSTADPRHDHAFAPFRRTHTPPPVLPFLLMQKLPTK